ncbi:streptamidine family RiPP [Streptomyces jumonjinensis]
MEQHKVFSPIAEQGQLAHLSATHSNALVENPFDGDDLADGVAPAADK